MNLKRKSHKRLLHLGIKCYNCTWKLSKKIYSKAFSETTEHHIGAQPLTIEMMNYPLIKYFLSCTALNSPS